MLDSSTRCLGMPLGRAYPEVDTLPSAYMRPVAYKPKRLNLHANEATILNLHAKVVTCQLSSGDGRPSTSTWTAASCRLLAWYCTTCRHAHAASSSHSMHVRAIHAHKLPSAECSQHMRFPCFRTYCCMHVAEYSFLHPLALLAGHLTRDLPCRLTRHCNIRAHPLTHCFRSLSHAISRDMLATRVSVDCVLRNLCAPSSQCGGREPLPSVACSVKPNGFD